MKRRNFLKSTALAGLSISAFNVLSSLDPGMIPHGKPFFKLSLAQWSLHRMFRNDGVDPFLFSSKAKKMGFEGIEYVNSLYFNHINSFSSVTSGMNSFIKKALTSSEEAGVKNLLIMIDGEGALSTPNQSERQKAVENHHKWIEAASAIGCHSIRVNLRGTEDPDEWVENSTASLLKLSEYGKEFDINVIVENHGGLSSNAELLVKAIKNTGMANCGTLPDFGNFCIKRDRTITRGNTCVDEYDRYKGVSEMMPYAKAVSAKSYDFNKKGNETTIDYERMLKIIHEAGYDGFIGVEYEGRKLSEKEGIIATKDLLLKLGKEI